MISSTRSTSIKGVTLISHRVPPPPPTAIAITKSPNSYLSISLCSASASLISRLGRGLSAFCQKAQFIGASSAEVVDDVRNFFPLGPLVGLDINGPVRAPGQQVANLV